MCAATGPPNARKRILPERRHRPKIKCHGIIINLSVPFCNTPIRDIGGFFVQIIIFLCAIVPCFSFIP